MGVPRRLAAAIGVVAIGTATGPLLAAASGQARAAPQAATVTLKRVAFTPRTVTVRHGGHVTFAWRDGDTPHNVTPTGRTRFRRLATRKAGEATVTFARKGTYRYVCTIHPGMTGTVIIR